MIFKKAALTSLLVMGISMPLLAQASDLTVTNHTKRDSTSIINNGACSTILGEVGITRAGQTNVIPESKIRFACLLNPSNCKADVYMTANCSGPIVATVIFDVKIGVKSIQVHDGSYSLSGSGFAITLSGGPALTAQK